MCVPIQWLWLEMTAKRQNASLGGMLGLHRGQQGRCHRDEIPGNLFAAYPVTDLSGKRANMCGPCTAPPLFPWKL